MEFHQDRLGYVEEIIPPDTLRIIEDDGTNRSTRIRRFNVKYDKVALIPRAGDGYINHRTLIQPPEPYEHSNSDESDTFSIETKELMSILKKTQHWTSNSHNKPHPFLSYLQLNEDKDKGWIKKFYHIKQSETKQKKNWTVTKELFS